MSIFRHFPALEIQWSVDWTDYATSFPEVAGL